MDSKELEMAKEVERVYRDTLDYKASYRQVEEMYKKSCSLPGSIRNNDTKTTDCIISDKEGMNNRDLI